ncbi:MAG: HNH endonuclease, partial [Gammaproteobacteria bacterium]|nr:HNH endonuclease [Gammaproteobacteria bacterium]
LDDDLFEYFRNDLTRDLLKELLLENLEDLSVQFHRWLRAMGKAERTANSYVSALRGTISNWANEADICNQNLVAIQSYSKIHVVAEQLAEYKVFKERNAVGNQMYSAALNSYKDFLSVTCQTQVAEDIQDIISDSSINSTQKAVLVNTRVGQGKFRESLIKYWKGCAVTGYATTQFLVASHIKPWRKADDNERLDPYNGLLLLPNIDKAFDLGYISFTEKGKIKTSEFIEAPEKLGLDEGMVVDLAKQHQDYLAYHRECVFEKSIN